MRKRGRKKFGKKGHGKRYSKTYTMSRGGIRL